MNASPELTKSQTTNDQRGDRFEVFFDGECPLCKREIDMVRRMDKQGKLILTDIADPGFKPPGLELDTLMREIHGRRSDGSFVIGVEVFREIYSRVGYRPLVAPTRWPIVRHVLNLGYWGFAKLRYWHAMHRAKKKPPMCGPSDERACSIETLNSKS